MCQVAPLTSWSLQICVVIMAIFWQRSLRMAFPVPPKVRDPLAQNRSCGHLGNHQEGYKQNSFCETTSGVCGAVGRSGERGGGGYNGRYQLFTTILPGLSDIFKPWAHISLVKNSESVHEKPRLCGSPWDVPRSSPSLTLSSAHRVSLRGSPPAAGSARPAAPFFSPPRTPGVHLPGQPLHCSRVL